MAPFARQSIIYELTLTTCTATATARARAMAKAETKATKTTTVKRKKQHVSREGNRGLRGIQTGTGTGLGRNLLGQQNIKCRVGILAVYGCS